MSATTLSYYETAAANDDDRRELYCNICNYGVFVRDEPPECPMCHSHSWTERTNYARWN